MKSARYMYMREYTKGAVAQSQGGSGATTTTGISTGYSAAQDVPGLDDGSCKKCVQVGELTCSRYHRLNQQDLYYFQSAPRDILALTFSRVQPSEPPDFCTCDQDIASSPSIPEARFLSQDADDEVKLSGYAARLADSEVILRQQEAWTSSGKSANEITKTALGPTGLFQKNKKTS